MINWSRQMAIFGWFDTSEADQFAQAIADDLSGRIPANAGNGGKKLSLERLQNAQQAIIARAQAFARNHRLNWYSRAHLGNTFRWALSEKGYDKAFVDTWTHNLLVAISTAKSTQPPSQR
jgi:hypothetical protein